MENLSDIADSRKKRLSQGHRREILRKSIHVLIAFVPSLAAINRDMTLLLLVTGILVYLSAESMRLQGRKFPLITWITTNASRQRDGGGIVMGPITLAMGAIMALVVYPPEPASLAIYALAFGDGIASLAGKIFPSARIHLLRGKTIAGSIACFTAVFAVSMAVARNFVEALVLAVTATILEAVPFKDLDNILIPLGTGLVALLLMR